MCKASRSSNSNADAPHRAVAAAVVALSAVLPVFFVESPQLALQAFVPLLRVSGQEVDVFWVPAQTPVFEPCLTSV